jgi:hypothetical protein
VDGRFAQTVLSNDTQQNSRHQFTFADMPKVADSEVQIKDDLFT